MKTTAPLARPPQPIVYVVEALTSVGTNLLTVGIFFYTRSVFGWSAGANLLLAMLEGIFYVLGALSAHPLAQKFAPRTVLIAAWCGMAVAAGAALLPIPHAAIVLLLMAYTFLSSIIWPILESYTAAGEGGAALSRRLATYNLVWAAVGPIMLAVTGRLIQHAPVMVFILPVIAHLTSVVLVLLNHRPGADSVESSAHLDPEPSLLRRRKLALWLSRIGMPAAYSVVYALMAVMPSLPVMQQLDLANQTLVSSTWQVVRWFVFLGLGVTVWWHTRPWIVIAASFLMLAAFFGVTLRPSDIGFGAQLPFAVDLTSMLISQAMLGLAIGVIYSASLYFGMVLSDGSTEHSGYHEALVGLGSVLGPGMGWAIGALRPGDLRWTLAAVGGVIGISIAGEFAAAFIAVRRAPVDP